MTRAAAALALAAALAAGLSPAASIRASAPRPQPSPMPPFPVASAGTAATGEPEASAVPAVATPAPPSPRTVTRDLATTEPQRTAHPSAAPRLHAVGTASWGDGWAGVVTRLPRGARIRVCGPLACWSGRSVGYGPARRTGRVADLSRAVFTSICSDLSVGLCRVRIWVVS